MFLIAHFIPPKSNSAVKTVSVSSDNDFASLMRYISRSHNLFIKEVTKKKTGRTHVNWNWKGFIGLFPLDLYLILWYFRPLHDVNFEINITQAKKFIGRFYHVFRGYSNNYLHIPHINIPQVHLRSNYEKKVLISLQNPFFWTWNSFSPYIFLLPQAMFAPWRSQSSFHIALYPVTGKSFIVLTYFPESRFWISKYQTNKILN